MFAFGRAREARQQDKCALGGPRAPVRPLGGPRGPLEAPWGTQGPLGGPRTPPLGAQRWVGECWCAALLCVHTRGIYCDAGVPRSWVRISLVYKILLDRSWCAAGVPRFWMYRAIGCP